MTDTTDADVPSRLVSAAERLIAQRGLEAVSLREVNAEAGVANASAVQYHYGGRAGLIRAILAKHHPAVEARRHALLDQFDADRSDGGPSDGAPSDGSDVELRILCGALVRPLAAELANPDGGPGYLQVMADLATRPVPVLSSQSLEDPSDSTYRWRALVAPLLSEEGVRLHRRFTALQFSLGELARRARDPRRADAAATDDRLFTSHLIDLVTALLAAPVSSETLRLTAETRSAPSE